MDSGDDSSDRGRDSLSAYIAGELGLDPSELPGSGAWSECGQTVGAFALRLGALSLDQIDAIIDFQSSEPMKFGQIAVHLGFLTEEDVQHLLDLQALHRGLEVAERLVLAGTIDIPTLCELMAGYHRKR